MKLSTHQSALESAATKLEHRMHVSIREKFTEEDYVWLFVPACFRSMWSEMTNYFDGARCVAFGCKLGEHPFTARLEVEHDVLKPRVWGTAVQEDAPEELVGRVRRWIEGTKKIKADFANVKYVVKELSKETLYLGLSPRQPLFSPKQARYLLPGLVTLANMNEKTKHLAEEMGGPIPRNIPSVDMGLRQNCRIAATSIAQAQLLPEELDNAVWTDSSVLTFSL